MTRKPTTRSAGKRRSITTLTSQLEEAYAAYKAIPDEEEKRWQRALAKVVRIGDRIVQAEAKTVDEMLLKIKIVTEHPDVSQTDGAERTALLSLGGDLRRLCRGGFIALPERFDHKGA